MDSVIQSIGDGHDAHAPASVQLHQSVQRQLEVLEWRVHAVEMTVQKLSEETPPGSGNETVQGTPRCMDDDEIGSEATVSSGTEQLRVGGVLRTPKQLGFTEEAEARALHLDRVAQRDDANRERKAAQKEEDALDAIWGSMTSSIGDIMGGSSEGDSDDVGAGDCKPQVLAPIEPVSLPAEVLTVIQNLQQGFYEMQQRVTHLEAERHETQDVSEPQTSTANSGGPSEPQAVVTEQEILGEIGQSERDAGHPVELGSLRESSDSGGFTLALPEDLKPTFALPGVLEDFLQPSNEGDPVGPGPSAGHEMQRLDEEFARFTSAAKEGQEILVAKVLSVAERLSAVEKQQHEEVVNASAFQFRVEELEASVSLHQEAAQKSLNSLEMRVQANYDGRLEAERSLEEMMAKYVEDHLDFATRLVELEHSVTDAVDTRGTPSHMNYAKDALLSQVEARHSAYETRLQQLEEQLCAVQEERVEIIPVSGGGSPVGSRRTSVSSMESFGSALGDRSVVSPTEEIARVKESLQEEVSIQVQQHKKQVQQEIARLWDEVQSPRNTTVGGDVDPSLLSPCGGLADAHQVENLTKAVHEAKEMALEVERELVYRFEVGREEALEETTAGMKEMWDAIKTLQQTAAKWDSGRGESCEAGNASMSHVDELRGELLGEVEAVHVALNTQLKQKTDQLQGQLDNATETANTTTVILQRKMQALHEALDAQTLEAQASISAAPSLPLTAGEPQQQHTVPETLNLAEKLEEASAMACESRLLCSELEQRQKTFLDAEEERGKVHREGVEQVMTVWAAIQESKAGLDKALHDMNERVCQNLREAEEAAIEDTNRLTSLCDRVERVTERVALLEASPGHGAAEIVGLKEELSLALGRISQQAALARQFAEEGRQREDRLLENCASTKEEHIDSPWRDVAEAGLSEIPALSRELAEIQQEMVANREIDRRCMALLDTRCEALELESQRKHNEGAALGPNGSDMLEVAEGFAAQREELSRQALELVRIGEDVVMAHRRIEGLERRFRSMRNSAKRGSEFLATAPGEGTTETAQLGSSEQSPGSSGSSPGSGAFVDLKEVQPSPSCQESLISSGRRSRLAASCWEDDAMVKEAFVATSIPSVRRLAGWEARRAAGRHNIGLMMRSFGMEKSPFHH